MSQLATRVRLFVASPGDTQDERDRLQTVVAELNRGIAEERELVLELVRWETHARPGIGGDAQEVINRQLPDPDFVVAMFWKRLGMPTPRAESGTAEELARAIERWHAQEGIEILIYFNQAPYTPSSTDLDQVAQLLAFRQKLQDGGLLVWEYDGVGDFEAKVRQHLTAAMREWRPANAAAPQARAAARRAARWKVTEDELETEVDAARHDDVQGLVADLRQTLTERGFTVGSGDRTATVVLELLANVREHSRSTQASVEIETRRRSVFSASVRVCQRGPAFDLDKELDAGRRAYEHGDREHGLVKVERLTSNLYASEDVPSAGWSGVECSVYDLPPPNAGVFGEFSHVEPICVEFEVPKRWWLGADFYSGTGIDQAMRFALTEPATRLLDLYLGGLRVHEDGYLGISFSGNVLPSEVIAEPIEREVAHGLPRPRSGRPIEAALEVYFHPLFEAKRVVMHAYETGFLPRSMLEEWAQLWDLPFFADADELRSFLRDAAR